MINNGMLKGRLMNGVKIKKYELLEALRENLEAHKDDVAEALELRREEMLSYFEEQIVKLNRDNEYQPKEVIKFPVPEDNSKEYEKVIRMVEMTQDDVIELDEDQFDKLVMDNWNFKQALLETSAFYGKAL